MENEIQVFTNEQFGQVRTVTIDEEPWFVAADVCKVLALSNPTMAVSRLDDDERAKLNLGRQGEGIIVSESGLYALVLSSRKAEARQFKRWITHEVIPSIRRHGAYMTSSLLEEVVQKPEIIVALAERLIAERLIAERKEKDLLRAKLEVVQPKADNFDQFWNPDAGTNIRNTAKELGVAQNIFVRELLERRYLYRDQQGMLMPYAQYAEHALGYFVMKDYIRPGGSQHQYTLITNKGKEHFRVQIKRWKEGK